MDMQLTDRRALITGSTSGIGYAIARALAAEGAQVTLTGRTQARVDEALKNSQREFYALDLSGGESSDGDPAELRRYGLQAAEEDGTLGTVCIYQAEDEEAIMEHAQRAELPADEVIPVANTVIIRDDP